MFTIIQIVWFDKKLIKGGFFLLDTGTHIVMGIALGGLATLDPTVAGSPATATSVLIATIVGSQIPDIDTVLKLEIMRYIFVIIEGLLIPFQRYFYGPAYPCIGLSLFPGC